MADLLGGDVEQQVLAPGIDLAQALGAPTRTVYIRRLLCMNIRLVSLGCRGNAA
jgi:hypothetical protein